MKPLMYFVSSSNGIVTISEEKFREIIDNAYEQGKMDAKCSKSEQNDAEPNPSSLDKTGLKVR